MRQEVLELQNQRRAVAAHRNHGRVQAKLPCPRPTGPTRGGGACASGYVSGANVRVTRRLAMRARGSRQQARTSAINWRHAPHGHACPSTMSLHDGSGRRGECCPVSDSLPGWWARRVFFFGRPRMASVRGNGDGAEMALAGGDGSDVGRAFGTDGEAVGRVLHVATCARAGRTDARMRRTVAR